MKEFKNAYKVVIQRFFYVIGGDFPQFISNLIVDDRVCSQILLSLVSKEGNLANLCSNVTNILEKIRKIRERRFFNSVAELKKFCRRSAPTP
uniref:Uncharacterized protein n=1 Tax=Romanomermis culicivorax TaxID=13658 RepID=A0A915JEV9_ROMCU